VRKTAPSPVLTFIVRITRDATGRLRGTVERVRTGEKERFTGADSIGVVVERMLDDDRQGRGG
jgi:hypothetical protein